VKQLTGAQHAVDRRLNRLRLEVLRGQQLSSLLTDELDLLADRCAAPAMARVAWLTATLDSMPVDEIWAVAVRDAGRVLRAAVVLRDQPYDDRSVVTLVGSATGHCSTVLADSPEAAALLGYGFARALQEYGGPVWAVLGPVPAAGPWLGDFVGTIQGGELVPVEGVPVVCRTTSDQAADYLSASMQRTLRKAANRAATDGISITIDFTSDPEQIADLLPALEQMHLDRDHDQGRCSELDDPIALQTWRSRLAHLAADDRLEVATLQIDGVLAAQVIGIRDPGAYRVLEGVLATRFSRYSPGRVLETALLQHVLDDPQVGVLDWMSSVASETLLATNDIQPVSMIRAAFAGVSAPQR
jgi:hypothetical protein